MLFNIQQFSNSPPREGPIHRVEADSVDAAARQRPLLVQEGTGIQTFDYVRVWEIDAAPETAAVFSVRDSLSG